MITFFSLFLFYFAYDFYRYGYFKSSAFCFYLPILVFTVEFIDYATFIGYGLVIYLTIGYVLAIGYCMLRLVSSKTLSFALVLMFLWLIALFGYIVRKRT